MRASSERSRWLPLIVLIAAIWPVWQWLGMRALHDSGDALALLSLATALLVLWRDRAGLARRRAQWILTIAFMLVYCLAYPFVPPLVRAMIGMSALAAACSTLWWGRRLDLALWGLLLLSLPWVATLNFYLGFPLRVVVGEVAALMLRMNGFDVDRVGTLLIWGGFTVSIDAPCSGVKMLWTGMYLTCALAALHRLSAAHTVQLAFFAALIVIAANILRATSLFFVEIYRVGEIQLLHSMIGLVMFVFAALGLAMIAGRMRVTTHAT